MKRSNGYVGAVGDLYARTPKAVWAAIAVSYALRAREDEWDQVVPEVLEEWDALHANGIVPQAPVTPNRRDK